MFNPKRQQLQRYLGHTAKNLQQQLKDFRLYDLGSYALNRFSSRQGYHLTENVAYGTANKQQLDLYVSKSKRYQQRPLVVFVYGGAWSHGDKNTYRFVGEALTRFGYDVAVINYHHAPQHKFPSYVDDLALALDFLGRHQQQYAVSTENIALMGHSAGAFNVASLLYHPRAVACMQLPFIRAIIGIAGPYHFDYLGDHLAQDAFDQSVPYQQVMPYYFVKENSIKHYLFLAEKDQIVQDKNTFDLHAELLSVGNHSHVEVIRRTGHISIMGSFASVFSRFFQTRTRVIHALDETFKDQRMH